MSLLNPNLKLDLEYVKMYEDVKDPVYGTDEAAGFDICVYSFEEVNKYPVKKIPLGVELKEGDAIKIHTGLRFNIPEGTYLAIVPRSGLGTKEGINLCNTPATIDSDYTGELIITIQKSQVGAYDLHIGDRIVQGILLPALHPSLKKINEKDLKITERGDKGFGSTGTK